MYKIYFFQSRFSKGLTLLEVIIAIFLVSVGIVGIYSLITQTLSSATTVSQKLIAGYLAQEGIEIVRNIRDSNWLEGLQWNSGLLCSTPPCDYEADYSDLLLSLYTSPGNPLNLENAKGFYGYGSGTQTKFKRKITIIEGSEPGNSINVQVEVSWSGHSITAQENLYNWYQ